MTLPDNAVRDRVIPHHGLARGTWLCLMEARPIVQAMVSLRYLAALLLLQGVAGLASPRALCAGISFVLANTAVYLFNGVCDVAADRRNGKGRPLARGALAIGFARRFLAVLVLAAVLLSLLVSIVQCLVVLGLLAAGTLYSAGSHRALRTPWIPPASILVGGSLTYLAACVGSGMRLDAQVSLLGLVMSLWMAVVGGIVKDLTDVRGDQLAGRRTFAVVYGRPAAARFGAGCALLLGVTLLGGALAIGSGELEVAGLVLLVAAAGVWRAARRGGGHASRRPYLAFMRGQYGVHLAVIAISVLSTGQ
ncbi:MAG TPA: UbiA family prenyltransferase [Jatrophihabitans sp.]|nr:UbiA family prenyltransferase [Jatrophihabitans sp.]